MTMRRNGYAGDNSGFFEFKLNDELEALWLEQGDEENFFWRIGMARPVTLEKLEASENEWLNSGESDEYGTRSYFISKYYSDEEKQELWNERGNKKRFRWRPGLRQPEAIA
jgi:hypothetical protein